MVNDKNIIKDLDEIISNPTKYANSLSVDKLVNLLKKLSDKYYNTGEPYVSDNVYDKMLEVLKKKDSDNPFLFEVGAPENRMDAVKLPYRMASLNKVKPNEKSLERWTNKYEGPYVLSDKLDGVSALLNKDNKGDIKLYTRGDGEKGRDITYLLKYLIDEKVLKKIPNNVAIRGEILMNKNDFLKYFSKDNKNARNMVSGFVNTNKIDTRVADKVQLISYSVINPRMLQSDQLETMKKWGLKVVYSKVLKNNKNFQNVLEKELSDRKKNSEFEVDGIVVIDDSEVYEHEDSNPSYSVAFKMNTEENMKDVEVKRINWSASKHGYLQPVIEIEPVELSGTTITFVTAHNAKYVVDNNIGPKSIIKIVRSGDVIPYVVEVVKPSKKPQMPEVGYKWNDTGVKIIATDVDDSTQRIINIKKILDFFRTLKVKFLSEGIMTKLYDNDYDTIFKIVKAADIKDEKMYNIDGLGKKMVDKIYLEIQNSLQKCKLEEMMSASMQFGEGLGVRKLKEIVKMYPNILDHKPKDVEGLQEMILNVPGFSTISSNKFSENFNNFMIFLKKLRKYTKVNLDFKPKKVNTKVNKKVVKKVAKKKKVESSEEYESEESENEYESDEYESDEDEYESEESEDESNDVSFTDEKIVMTGFRDSDIEEFIENNGGKVSSSVSKNTTLVIYVPSDKGSNKINKAKDLGIKTITKTDFIKKYQIK